MLLAQGRLVPRLVALPRGTAATIPAASAALRGSASLAGKGAQSQAAAATARRHGRSLKGLGATTRVVRPTSSPDDGVDSMIDALQGEWGDDKGLKIQISGKEARFSDLDAQAFTLEGSVGDTGPSLRLRGASLVGPVTAPVWRFPDGLERHWARMEPSSSGDIHWKAKFLQYKEDRLQIRRQLVQAFADNDLEAVISLRLQWQQQDEEAARTFVPRGVSEQQEATLLAGRRLVPGVCFRHKKFDYRGVIIACDPWCSFPSSWRARWVPNRPAGEAQPFYHCLLDERDREGKQSYVAQENMIFDDTIFPVKSALLNGLFTASMELGSYVPNSILEDALRRQRASIGFRF